MSYNGIPVAPVAVTQPGGQGYSASYPDGPKVLSAVPYKADAYGQNPSYSNNVYGSPPAIASPPQAKQSRVLCFAAVFIVLFIVVPVIGIIAYFAGDLGCPFPLNEEIREGNDMVSLVFSECPSNAQYDAFVSAARRWSTIIEGTVIESTIVANAAASDICPFLVSSFVFGPNDELDHLLIFAEPIAIDGPGGVLAAAGPCAVSDGFFPVVGGMQFDTDDLEGLEDDGTLEDVILHEMGHVLGIGTLWSLVQQGGGAADFQIQTLLQDAVFSGNTPDVNAVPVFEGTAASAEFTILSGVNQVNVPVEDGRIEGEFVLFDVANGEGLGSIDGHWKIENFVDELMVFAIDPSFPEHPLSRMSLASLEDLGYTVNLDLADDFSLSTLRAKKQSLRGDEANVHYLKNDVYNVPITLLPPAN